MILKSYEIENNIKNILNYSYVLIYGENIGLKEVLKKKIIYLHNNSEIINIYNDDLTKNKDILFNEVSNNSLFAQKKLIIINQVNEQIVSQIETFLERNEETRIIIIAGMLDKKSKLRSLFEKEKKLATIPCYKDTEITLRKLIQTELINFKNLNSNTVNMILGYSNLNRKTILDNLEKIKLYFDKKELTETALLNILNSDRNELFENLRDAALNGNKKYLNDLLGNFSFNKEDTFQYLNMISYRLMRLLQIHRENSKYQNFEDTINHIKPPIFWKDKPIYLKLSNKWHKQKVLDVLSHIIKIEKMLKKNSNLNQVVVLKNTITVICSNSMSYF